MIDNRIQYVSFYNTTGVIEREHNLFYAPRMSTSSLPIWDRWLLRFNSVTKHDTTGSKYWNKRISQWSPKDRVLSIQGEIERFRRKDNNSNPFNYVIVSETLYTSEEGVSTADNIYTGFFIIDAKQTGIGTVRLELEPDDFTNVFFLQNKNTATQPFNINNYLKNVYVERQHYDRVTSSLAETNLHIFANYEESFRYKRQYRNYKRLLNYGNPLTDNEKTLIEQTDSFVSLPQALRIKCYKLSCAFLHIVLNTQNILLSYAYPTSSTTMEMGKKPRTLVPNVYPLTENNLTTVICPIAVVPDYLMKYKTEIQQYYNRVQFKSVLAGDDLPYLQYAYIRDFLGDDLLRNYVLTAYVTKESYLFNDITFTANNPVISNVNVRTYDVPATADLDRNTLAVFPFEATSDQLTNITANNYGYSISKNDDGQGTAISYSITVRDRNTNDKNIKTRIGLIERYQDINFNLDLTESGKDTRSNYYEPILSFNPYSFYTISYLGRIETPLNKANYYQEPNISIKLNVSVTDVCKYSVLPKYTINNLEQNMYQEGIEVTLANQLSVSSESLAQYVIANQTQMKNQYAVNSMNLGKGLVSGITGGLGAGIRTGAMFEDAYKGVVAGGVQAGAELIGSAITWGFNQAEIGMTQKAKLADMGNLPDNIKQVGTDINIDLNIAEMGLYLNHYTIDELSYNSICKYLERYGYLVNIYDTIHDYDRKGWNYVKLVDFEFDINVSVTQEETIRQIFTNGVTLLHEPSYLHSSSLHNYEIILD